MWRFFSAMKEAQCDDFPVPQVVEGNLEVIKDFPQERLSGRTMEKMDDVPVPTTESLEVVQITPKERISERVHEHIVDVPMPLQEGIVEVIQPIP